MNICYWFPRLQWNWGEYHGRKRYVIKCDLFECCQARSLHMYHLTALLQHKVLSPPPWHKILWLSSLPSLPACTGGRGQPFCCFAAGSVACAISLRLLIRCGLSGTCPDCKSEQSSFSLMCICNVPAPKGGESKLWSHCLSAKTTF